MATFSGWTLGLTTGPKYLGLYPGTAPPRSTSDVGRLAVCLYALGGPVARIVVLSASPNPGNGTIVSMDIQVLDQYSNPVNGVPVTFTPLAGGSVSPAVDTTRHVPSSLDGQAFTTWTRGSGTEKLTIAAGGLTITYP
jgi:hypothetical protein